MPAIQNYLDYREFLRDFYVEKKAQNPLYSYQVLANRAGFKSKSFLAHVIEGTKNLSDASVESLCAALDLKEKEAAYFTLLVAFNQARSHAQKDRYFSELAGLTSRLKARLMLRGAYGFYARWYHNTVRELVTMLDFKDDYAVLARHLKPRITARQARQSVKLLLKLGLVRQENGRYVQVDPDITTGDTVQSLAVTNFHLQNLDLAGLAIDICPAQERDLGCMVVGLSPAGFNRIKEEIRDFRRKLVQVIGADTNPSRVYHLSMQIFPTSEWCRGGRDDVSNDGK